MRTGVELSRSEVVQFMDRLVSDEECDFLVIGSGAGGSVAAHRLAKAGFKTVVLEEGEAHFSSEFDARVGAWTRELYRNGGVIPILGNPSIAFGEGRALGGGTVVNGGLIWRTPDWILDDWSRAAGLGILSKSYMAGLHERVEEDLAVQATPWEKASAGTNRDSIRLGEGAARLGWKVVGVPRALHGCKNLNLCATGCPSGAKQSTMFNYLPMATGSGARLLVGARVSRVEHSGGRATAAWVEAKAGGEAIRIRARNFIIAAGATQSPKLVHRSRLHPRAGRIFNFHLNLKIVARFDDRIDAARGTLTTCQVQEFEQSRIVMMTSNFQAAYLALALQNQRPAVLREALGHQEHYGIFVAMVRPHGAGGLTAVGDSQVGSWRPGSEDRALVGRALHLLAAALFESGAKELFLPIHGSMPCRSLQDVDRVLDGMKLRQCSAVSVHGMSGCRMGAREKDSVVDPNGKIWGMENVWLCDSSILPTSTGESPQGTIMALAHHVLGRIVG